MERYTSLRVLREAIYGRVVLCHRHQRQDELVAIKMMSLTHITTKKAPRGGHTIKEDGEEEFEVLKRLTRHPNVLQLQDYFEHDNMLCLVFEYCSNGELFDYIHLQRSKSVSENQAAMWFRQIVDGVQHIHAAGIAHRDLSLENILLDAEKQCRICDFGLSSQRGKWCSGRVGKAFYMAPEVYLGEYQSYDGFKADIWSLGILLFIMMGGIPPFEVPTDADARFRILRQDGIQMLAKMWGLSMSTEALDLVSSMVKLQPNERLNLDEIGNHPWFELALLNQGTYPSRGGTVNQVRVA